MQMNIFVHFIVLGVLYLDNTLVRIFNTWEKKIMCCLLNFIYSYFSMLFHARNEYLNMSRESRGLGELYAVFVRNVPHLMISMLFYIYLGYSWAFAGANC